MKMLWTLPTRYMQLPLPFTARYTCSFVTLCVIEELNIGQTLNSRLTARTKECRDAHVQPQVSSTLLGTNIIYKLSERCCNSRWRAFCDSPKSHRYLGPTVTLIKLDSQRHSQALERVSKYSADFSGNLLTALLLVAGQLSRTLTKCT